MLIIFEKFGGAVMFIRRALLFVALLALVIIGISTGSFAQTIIIENNTELPLEISVKSPTVFPRSYKVWGYVNPVSEKGFGISTGYWEIKIRPNISSGEYPILYRSVVINRRNEVKRIVLVDRDFGRSAILPPAAGCNMSMNGKYSNLLKTLNVPQDASRYGSCHDYGRWNAGSYAGHSDIPEGYWVYVKPYWYIWGSVRGGGTTPSKKTDGCDETMGGKYSNQLRTLNIPGDKGQYGTCNDWGEWSGTEYKGHKNLPKGYWVYEYPNWIIWGRKNQ